MKIPGMCSVCGAECFDIIQWHETEPLEGQPAKIGAPHADAVRVTAVQIDGSQVAFTVHDYCVDDINWPRLWTSVIERMVFDDKHRKAFGGDPLTDEQQAQYNAHSLKFFDNRPLGIIAVERWQDVRTDK